MAGRSLVGGGLVLGGWVVGWLANWLADTCLDGGLAGGLAIWCYTCSHNQVTTTATAKLKLGEAKISPE